MSGKTFTFIYLILSIRVGMFQIVFAISLYIFFRKRESSMCTSEFERLCASGIVMIVKHLFYRFSSL